MVGEGSCVTVKTETFNAKSAGDPFGKLFAKLRDSKVFCNVWYENRVLGRDVHEGNSNLDDKDPLGQLIKY